MKNALKAVSKTEKYDDILKYLDDLVAKNPEQLHHYVTNKNSKYTDLMKDILSNYGLDIDGAWNKDLLPHQGRHPNAYHKFILNEMKKIDMIAQGDAKLFMELFEQNVKSVIRNNPDMLYAEYWINLAK